MTPRVGIFGWGLIAPRSPNIETFERNLACSESWLEPFNGYGPDNFLVGTPEFCFESYKEWIDERFSPRRFQTLDEKMDLTTKYAVGAFIQSLQQNPGLEEELRRLGSQARVYVGCGLGALPTIHEQSIALHRAQRRWDRFWACPQRNSVLCRYLKLDEQERQSRYPDAPPSPESTPESMRDEAEERWWNYWAHRSPQLQEYLSRVREIESANVEGDIASGKMSLIKQKRRLHAKLQSEWQSPEPPWSQISANLIWNIHNTPSAQISMLGGVTGMTFAPVAACSTFGLALKLAMDAVRAGDAKAVVVGASDPPPHPLTVGAFYNSRVIAADGAVSKPLSGLRGTHISGGSALWIVGDYDHMTSKGFRPLGMEPLAVGVTADADHIITPSKEGPTQAIVEALRNAGIDSAEVATWDLHATATPGDYQEVENLRRILPDSMLVTARKGTFGHGMAAGGGWELTAQYLSQDKGETYPTPLSREELNPEIAQLHNRFVFRDGCRSNGGVAGKLSMGIGGINACVISRPWQ